jgi:asparagine synthase (glutamine-hydrolysing)
MCGICGIINFDGKPAEDKSIRQMMQIMKHRGPDDEGMFIHQNIGLGFVRLSIIDLSLAGHQPMISSDERYVVVFNGEIYNYIELKRELISKGHKFTSNTDTEVLLASYIEWGESCLDKFNGMWAFVIFDRKLNHLFGARDRFGVKPFYYCYTNSSFIFASDIPSILSQLASVPEPDEQVIFNYLNFGRTDYSEHTFYQKVFKLQHGHSFTIKDNTLNFRRWYSLNDKNEEPFKEPGEFFELLKDSINLRMRSDVPVGVCLSGGLDSSSIVSILKSTLPLDNIKTFSAIYGMKHRADESEYIDEVANNLPFSYKVKPTLESYLNDLDRLFEAHSEPFSTSAIYAQFKVMELAKGKATVLLDGQGADEYLCGYHYFYGYYFKELFRNWHLFKLMSEIVDGYRNTKSLLGISSFLYFSLPQFGKELFMSNQNNLLDTGFFNRNIRQSPIFNELYAGKSIHQTVINHFEYKLEHLLKWEDRNSMYFGLESRVPFLDYRLVEKALNTHYSQFIDKGWTKKILRDELKGILPDKIRLRKDKVGFATPEEIWFRDKSFISLYEKTINGNNDLGKFINSEKLQLMMKEHFSGRVNHSSSLWRVFNLKKWMQKNYIA